MVERYKGFNINVIDKYIIVLKSALVGIYQILSKIVLFHVSHNTHDKNSVHLNKSFAIDHYRYLINGEILACSFDVFRSSAISAHRTHGCLKYKDQSRRHITVHIGIHVKCPILAEIGIFRGIPVKIQM